MKLITLNLWGGTVYEPLIRFIKEYAESADVFCFQEMIFGGEPGFTPLHKARLNLFAEIETCLSVFTPFIYRAPEDAAYFQREVLPEGAHPGQAIFVRKTYEVIAQGGFRSYAGGTPNGVNMGGKITGSCQWIELRGADKEPVTILNVHGLWQENTHKADTPERLRQSEIITDFLSARSGKRILCGDFNLNPGTQSLARLEQGMTNLINAQGITSTRTSLYDKPERFADYMLVSPEVEVKAFKVLPEEVSDHNALELEC